MSAVDVLIVGAGPAGLTAAVVARRYGLTTMVIDEQSAPGGQIWRSVETSAGRDQIFGESYTEGRVVAQEFRRSGANYRPSFQLWMIEPGFCALASHNRQARAIEAKTVILATGAQERPVPFPGWTLPGVLTVGAAQILLKSSNQIPAGNLWIAGSGPLLLLYATQLLRAGGSIAGYLDTTPPGQWRKALRHLPRALRGSSDLLKGIKWMSELRRSGTPIAKGVHGIEALGSEKLESLRYIDKSGSSATVAADTLLIHEGIVPSIHPALALECDIRWNSSQDCFVPVLDEWGESSIGNLFIAGDGAGIAGAKAAQLRGELAAIRIAQRLSQIDKREALRNAAPVRKKLQNELAIRPFLDALFKPRAEIFAPSDETIVCRCEAITARTIRELAVIGSPGPNQLKGATRAGMGPCQGRQCGYTVTNILSAVQQRTQSEVGFYHVRPPLKPVTLGELSSLLREDADHEC